MTALRIMVGIATLGRPTELRAVLEALSAQRRLADRVVVCHTSPDDVADLVGFDRRVEFVTDLPGSVRQRNRILDAASDSDIVLFLDDDFLPATDYLKVLEEVLLARPDAVAATGRVVADGVRGPGLSVEEGQNALAADTFKGDKLGWSSCQSCYGCNMAVRVSTVRAHHLRLDEKLPLYGWLEDVDFTRRLGIYGAVIQIEGARGVHLGSKSGRGLGVRLGYSQVVNPVYLARKGSYPWVLVPLTVARPVARNVLRMVHPEPYIDRRDRLRGNLIGIWDLIRGSGSPERILEL